MKKFAYTVLALLALSVFLAGCGKNAKLDTSHCTSDFEGGISAALRENKQIILFFSSDEDEKSPALKENLLETADFLTALTEKYVLVNLDFSASRFESVMAPVPEDSKREEKAQAEARARLTKDMKTAMAVAAQGSPAFYLLTKEGYPVAAFAIDAEATAGEFVASMNEQTKDALEAYTKLLSAADSATGSDKVRALDAVFEATNAEWRYLVLSFSRQIVQLDKNNDSGVVGKHILALANGRATDLFLEQDVKGASAEFVNAAQNALLTAEEKQEAYYTAGYLLAQGGSTDYDAIQGLLQLAYDAAPESAHAADVRLLINAVAERIAMQQEMQKDVELSADEGYTDINPGAAPDAPAAE